MGTTISDLLQFLDEGNRGIGLVVKLLLVFGGMIIFYVARTNLLVEEE